MAAAYGRVYAGVYDQKWTDFAVRAAPRLYEYATSLTSGGEHRTVLDIGCGTGNVLLYFLDKGYEGTGLDLSPHMLEHARRNCSTHVEQGRARFFEADATSFTVDSPSDVALATFDMYNHLPDYQHLELALAAARRAVSSGGVFLFDLVTRRGMYRWNIIEVDDSEGSLVISRGIYDGQGEKAHYRHTGFVERSDGLYERFDETGSMSVYDLEQVRQALIGAGWSFVHFARPDALESPLDAPENENRVFVVARAD